MAEPTCHYCNRPAEEECPACGRFYCGEHGEDVCIRCLAPEAAIPSATVFRGSLVLLVIASVVALFLWIDPPRQGTDTGPVIATVTAPGQGGATATPTPSAGAAASASSTAAGSASPSATAATASATATAPGNTYTVVAGDTLETIATAHNTTTERIQALNPGLNPNLLPGTVLVLP
jgi:LysM repeat protein